QECNHLQSSLLSPEQRLSGPRGISPAEVGSGPQSSWIWVPSRLSVSYCSKLRHIIDEMVTTEREYVRSLCYIIDSYFPEMERLDLPQDLRGKRSVIFGNLEKLYDFHSQYFLRELESCCNHPLRVSHFRKAVGVSAYLGAQGTPREATALTLCCVSQFKQVQLGDKMDLASYLLKPIQRMSKYALLLKDLIKECSEAQEQELGYLRAAEEMVKFQLRHGNDLLAMDAIRDCDVCSGVLPCLGEQSHTSSPSLNLGSLDCMVNLPTNSHSDQGAICQHRAGSLDPLGQTV
uniref:DH domain-containing protein n=1 Tax=Athene cunicularia TaxID=194338 RepID=A0A663MPN1_ATHCN